jgi:hypothetical protein
MRVVGAEAEPAFAEVAFRHWAGANYNRIAFLTHVDQPNPFFSLVAIVLHRLIDGDDKLSSGQR